MSRKAQILTLVFAALLLMTSTLSMAGSETDPEVLGQHNTGDVPFRDIIAGWVEEETATEFDLVIQVDDSPERWDPDRIGDQLTNVTTYEYGFYFSYMGTHFSATGIVGVATKTPILGIDVVMATGELRTITYSSGHNVIENETHETDISVVWDPDRIALVLSVPKENIGSPAVGDEITNLWIAIWNADENPSDEPRNILDAKDTAKSFLEPGRNYEFTGGLQYDYDISLAVSEALLELKPGQVASINVTVVYTTSNEEDANATVAILTDKDGPGEMSLDNTRFVFNRSDVDATILTYTAPENITERQYVNITLMGELTVTEEGVETVFRSNPVNITITLETVIDEGDTGDENIIEQILGFLMSLIGMIIMGAVVAVIVIIIVLKSMKKKREELYTDIDKPVTAKKVQRVN